MELLDEEEEIQKTQEQFDEICIELNVDQKIADIAWRGYEAVRKQCILEGLQVSWLACSVFVASWLCPPQTLANPNGRKATALVIVDKCKLSIIEFFEKLRKWINMANMSKRYSEQVERMENCFAVTSVVFKKFEPIFNELFVENFASESPSSRDKPKTRSTRLSEGGFSSRYALSCQDVKSFCWLLFVFMKRSSLGIQDDLIKSHHLLLCCMDFIYENLSLSKGLHLINKPFADSLGSTDENSLIERLCSKYDGLTLDAKQMRVHWFRAKLKNLVAEEILLGNAENFDEFLSDENFSSNMATLHENYEKLISKKGDMDERIFVPQLNKHEISPYALNCTPFKLEGHSTPEELDREKFEKELLLRRNVEACLERVSQLPAPTPLTGRRYLGSDYFCPIDPETALQSANKLQSLLANLAPCPSHALLNILSSYKPEILSNMNHIVADAGEAFLLACTQNIENSQNDEENISEIAKQRREMAEILYFRILERVIKIEREKAGQSDLSNVLNQTVFHKALLACCYELVLFSLNSNKTFPWILKTFDLHAFHFYKVIELVIRPEPDLSREMVKHLNRIEERVLEELAWAPNSPLWSNLAQHAVPSCEEVALPAPLTKIINLQSILSGSLRQNFAGGSPLNAIVLSSPLKHGAAKRRLDFDNEKPAVPFKLSGITIRPANNGAKLSAGISRPTGGKVTLKLIGRPSADLASNASTVKIRDGKTLELKNLEGDKPKTASNGKNHCGSLALFFRKVYYLTSLRLHHLCEGCRATDQMKQNAWTVFHQALTQHVDLMKGRHVDQLLMCSLYVISKVAKFDISFHDIMSSYRQQPQARSRVYRNVLLGSKPSTPTNDHEVASFVDESVGSSASGQLQPVKLRSGSTMPVPAISSAPPTPTPFEEDHGDLIKFYNSIFVAKLEPFAKKFQPSDDQTDLNSQTSVPSSPLPNVRPYNGMSPRKKIVDGIYVSPMKPNTTVSYLTSPSRPLRYSFYRSPAKDLRAINDMLRGFSRAQELSVLR